MSEYTATFKWPKREGCFLPKNWFSYSIYQKGANWSMIPSQTSTSWEWEVFMLSRDGGSAPWTEIWGFLIWVSSEAGARSCSQKQSDSNWWKLSKHVPNPNYYLVNDFWVKQSFSNQTYNIQCILVLICSGNCCTFLVSCSELPPTSPPTMLTFPASLSCNV